MARFLNQLEDLWVVECGLEEIVALEDGAEAAARLVFPKVTLLMLFAKTQVVFPRAAYFRMAIVESTRGD